MPPDLCRTVRAGILFAAPMLHRLGHVTMSPPGGDVIGRRRLDTHFLGLEALGAEIVAGELFQFRAPRGLKGEDIFLPEASVTGTAQVLMAAVLAHGATVIRNAAAEPHIQDLCVLLRDMGAQIEGVGSNTLTVHGVARLHGARHRIGSDYTEVGSFLAFAAATGGAITVRGVDPTHYRLIARVFERLGVNLEFRGDTVSVRALQELRVKSDIGGGIPTIDTGIWPQFPTDLLSVMIVLATQAQGTVLFFEKLYESRLYFVDRLIVMGANGVICDPHRVVISGPSKLHGIEMNSPDIRAGIALVGAALCAQGRSIIRNIRFVDRGYERIEEKLRALGADVQRVPDTSPG
jgi:UDP-N-acetylglucosamine 1-carboxyvinyltransferase